MNACQTFSFIEMVAIQFIGLTFPYILKAGHDFGIRNVGMLTMRSLRVEKFIPFWAEELDSTVTPYEVGKGYKVKLNVSNSQVLYISALQV